MVRGVQTTALTPLPKRCRTTSSCPHSRVLGTPVVGGATATWALSSCPTNPLGVQLTVAIRPPEQVTRSSSAAARFGRKANMVMVVSKASSG